MYPVLKHQKQIKLTLAVSPTEITSVKQGQKVRLQVSRNIPVPIILNGIVSNIDTAPAITKNGNLFMVTANVSLSKQQARSLHYGLTGKVSIITGQKTYFNFWRDRLFNQD
uniref:HlyD family efflux transporter periplasmic adaptor subunit n=1 Tax=Lacticaseibacillus paracasei TaxID=1597 RepID=UPI003BAAC02B